MTRPRAAAVAVCVLMLAQMTAATPAGSMTVVGIAPTGPAAGSPGPYTPGPGPGALCNAFSGGGASEVGPTVTGGPAPAPQASSGFGVQAGTNFSIATCNWFPRTDCTNRAVYTLTVGNQTYGVGSLAPDLYAVGLGLFTSSPVQGDLTIPDAVNLTTNNVIATLNAKQTLDFGLPVLGCVTLLSKTAAPLRITVTPAVMDPTVISNVEAGSGTPVAKGPLTLTWTLSRGGEVRVSLFDVLTPKLLINVLQGGGPVLDAQRPQGPNSLTVALADGAGHAYPPGSYEFQIALIDPPGTKYVPAETQSVSFYLR